MYLIHFSSSPSQLKAFLLLLQLRLCESFPTTCQLVSTLQVRSMAGSNVYVEDDYDMMSRMSSCGTTPKDMIYDIPLGVPSLEKIATSGNPATSDPTTKECSYADEATRMLTSDYKSLQYCHFVNESYYGKSVSIVQPRLEGRATNDTDTNALLLKMSHDVLYCVPEETERLLVELMTLPRSPQRVQVQSLVEKQKSVADKLTKHSSWINRFRACVDDCGTMYVVENDPMNPCLGVLETELLIRLAGQTRKHCNWKEAVLQILDLPRPGNSCLAHEALGILTKYLETTRRDQEKLQSLSNESWEGIRLEKWLPQTVCRIFGYNFEDEAPYAETKLRLEHPEAFKLTRLLIDMQYMGLDKDEIPKMLKYVHPFNRIIPSLSLQQDDIEGEIEYHRKKVENLAKQDQKSPAGREVH